MSITKNEPHFLLIFSGYKHAKRLGHNSFDLVSINIQNIFRLTIGACLHLILVGCNQYIISVDQHSVTSYALHLFIVSSIKSYIRLIIITCILNLIR